MSFRIEALSRVFTFAELDVPAGLIWADVRFGIAHGIIMPTFAIDYAVVLAMAADDPSDDLLALCAMDPRENIDAPLALLASHDDFDEAGAKRVWGDMLLAWAYRSRADIPDLQGLIEGLYADFDYPEAWISMIGYMPQDGPWSAEASLAAYLVEHFNK